MTGRDPLDDVRVVIVHYRTPDLLEQSVASLRLHYPGIALTIVDNGSTEETRHVLEQICSRDPECTEGIVVEENEGHGPGMDRAIQHAEETYLFCLDSDTIVRKGGFIEKMIPLFVDESVYGVGRVVRLDQRGFNSNVVGHETIAALDPAFMLLRRSHYLKLEPFRHHGSPVVHNFRSAESAGMRLVPFDIASSIDHLHRGTVNRHGYGLGIRSKIDFLLHKLGF